MRNRLSVIGAFLLLYIVLVNLSAYLLFFLINTAYDLCVANGLTGGAELIGYYTQGGGFILYVLALNAITQYLIGMPVAAYFMKKFLSTEPAEEGSRVSVADAVMIVPIVFFLMIAGSVLGSLTAGILGNLTGENFTNSTVEMLVSGTLPVTILFVVIIAPIAEELFFRRLLIDLVRPIGRRGAVMLSGVCFALFHQNLFQFFYTLFLGIVLALIYEKTRRIRYTILIHILVNFVGGLILPWSAEVLETLDPDALAAGILPPQILPALLFFAAFFLLVIVGMVLTVIWIARGRMRLEERPEAPSYRDFRRAFITSPGMLLYMIVCIGFAAFNLFG